MSPSKPVKRGPDPTDAQSRVINAALELFAEHGVGGTSLRMIATELGVTVAAVYHQFHTKDEIIRAAAESELLKLQAVVEGAESQATTELAREALITGMVDLTLGVGRSVSAVLSDPVVTASFRRNPQLRDLVQRMGRLLTDESTTREARIRTAILIAAINGVATHPFVADIDDEALRGELLYLGHQLLSR